MTVTLSYKGNTAELATLTAQHFGYEVLDAPAGLAARRWRVAGLVTPDVWQDVIDVYAAWRNDRMNDPDSKASGSIGTTVSLNATGYTVTGGEQTWAGIACWLLDAPTGESLGAYVAVSFQVVDAAQWLAAANKQVSKSLDRAYFGTWVLGACTLNLLQPAYTYQDVPNLQLTAGGVSFISGTRAFTRVAQLVGHTDAQGYSDARAWFETTVTASPAVDSWYPISPLVPEAEAIHDIINGVRVDIYTLSVTLAQIR